MKFIFIFFIFPETGEVRILSRILLSRTTVFILCQSIKLIPDVFEIFACKPFHYEIGECPYGATQIINIVIHISHLSLTINAGANLLLYIFYGKHLHDSLIKVT